MSEKRRHLLRSIPSRIFLYSLCSEKEMACLIRIPLNSCTVGTTPPVHPYREIRIFSYSFQSD
ncbi:hypothetical protein DVJ83_06060 [Deinococcus wulumuqiensis]|uniref:Uncharacterized protein n=1 Tax=Deinococcus wulumuqiensis TaxID=980427 RepID=A0A345IGH8_9DEIO|nr:hypothetical protein DVJ83_06060 [Deinococcus wulumuqiensis]